MKTYQKLLSILVLILALAGLSFIAYFGIGDNFEGAVKSIKLGLDLAGGVSITYQTVEENPSSQDMDDTIYRLQKRVEGYSTEANVYKEGDNRISVEIPDVTDANAILEELGQPGTLIFMDTEGTQIITGNNVESAEAQAYKDNAGTVQYVVSLELDEEGAASFGEATTRLVAGSEEARRIYIIYNNEVVSAPYVKSAITDGSVMIDNMESLEYAQKLASTIRIGAIPLELKELRSNVVGASLGQDAIKTSLVAGAIGLAILGVFMILVYRIPGLAATFALALYTLLMLFLLSVYDITLTLPGIAGIILSIGMAVDANVVIFARVREELKKGKSVDSSIKDGYSKALSAILDGNITTLIAAAVLAFRGSGSVKGFATTLALGTCLSMFTALVVTKWLMNLFYHLGAKVPGLYGLPKDFKVFDFVGKKTIAYCISILVIGAGLVTMLVNQNSGKGAFNYSLEFIGGTTTTVTFNEAHDQSDVETNIIPVIQEATGVTEISQQIVTDGSNQVVFKTSELSLDQREAFVTAMVEKFGVAEDAISAENISATVSSEMKQDAIVATAIATVCMLLYIWFRFSSVTFAAAAVTALIQDVLVVIGFYAVSRISLGNTFIACILTIVGYSINATIVIFDRIRENLKAMKASRAEIVNTSITQTLGRSINTSLTTFIMIFVLYVVGVASIREFALPIMVGVVAGTYSSIFMSATVWYVYDSFKEKKNAKKNSKAEA
ncbi:MAG: protein translocase subunit SecD [Lachnospiraceae bacterium]|nr:protein translocase subunit SecD [Lachnospiraceae bacterium]